MLRNALTVQSVTEDVELGPDNFTLADQEEAVEDVDFGGDGRALLSRRAVA